MRVFLQSAFSELYEMKIDESVVLSVCRWEYVKIDMAARYQEELGT